MKAFEQRRSLRFPVSRVLEKPTTHGAHRRAVGRDLTHSLRSCEYSQSSSRRASIASHDAPCTVPHRPRKKTRSRWRGKARHRERQRAHVHLGAFAGWQSALESRSVNASRGSHTRVFTNLLVHT